MKRTYLAKRNALLLSTDVSWGTGALAVVIFILAMRLVLPNFFWYVFTPVFHVADSLAAGTHTFFSAFENAATLAAQNEDLSNKNALLSVENKTLSQKVDDLVALLGGTTPATISGVPAGVIARPPESPYDTLVVAAGSEEGVTVGQEAFGAGGTPLGIVDSVEKKVARITLFSAPGVSTNGWVGSKAIPLTLVGVGGGVLSASGARSAGMVVGDTVFASGPGKLPVGVVTRIDGDPASAQVTLRIMSVVNIFSIAWVELRDTGVKLFGAPVTATSTLP